MCYMHNYQVKTQEQIEALERQVEKLREENKKLKYQLQLQEDFTVYMEKYFTNKINTIMESVRRTKNNA